MMPNFLVVGAVKAGTTSLYNYLRAHPQVFMPGRKELCFFVAEENWPRGVPWYESQFAGGENAIAVGEASPQYTIDPVYSGVPARVARLMPQARLIYLVRHPVERMKSHYLENFTTGAREESIEKALVSNPIYLNASRYATQLERYLEYFPREQILVVTSEQLRAARRETLGKIFTFLGVDREPNAAIFEREFNNTASKRVRRRLFEIAARSAAYATIKRLTPAAVRRFAHPLVTRRMNPVKAVISKKLERRLTDALRDEVKRLYRYMDDAFDGWGIETK